MKLNIYVIIGCILLCAASSSVNAQGCVAVKNMSTCSMNWGDNHAKGWQFSLNYRYFRSYKHFRGKHEEKERVENNTEVINNDNSINLGINYTFNNRFSVSVIIPYIFIDRSSLYEHLGNGTTSNPNQERFHTQSTGLGDMRLIAYYNTLPATYTKGTVMLGLGIKAPTGEYNAKDYFHKTEGLVELPVDQSIQPGDGGLGIITEVDFSHLIKGKIHGYANALYMLNPRNTNGTLRGNTPTNDASGNPIALSNEMSVTDQYMLRAGARFMTHSIQASLGGRMECIPVEDLIGKSDGFRRPGYAISIEPSLFYTKGQHTVGFNFPVAVARNRTRSVLDRKRGNDAEGKPIQGDAAFADWLVSVTYAYKLNK